MYSSDYTNILRSRALQGCCQGPAGPAGPAGPGIQPLYGSFLSMTEQHATVANPVAITYSERTIGTINVNGTFPNSEIVIPTTGVFSILFSAQCDSSGGTRYLEIFPVINGASVPKSNTRIKLNATTEACLVVEYILSFNANDKFQLFMIGDHVNARLLALISAGGTTPVVPDIPSIIVNIKQIE